MKFIHHVHEMSTSCQPAYAPSKPAPFTNNSMCFGGASLVGIQVSFGPAKSRYINQTITSQAVWP